MKSWYRLKQRKALRHPEYESSFICRLLAKEGNEPFLPWCSSAFVTVLLFSQSCLPISVHLQLSLIYRIVRTNLDIGFRYLVLDLENKLLSNPTLGNVHAMGFTNLFDPICPIFGLPPA
jgi:hypothetical protein